MIYQNVQKVLTVIIISYFKYRLPCRAELKGVLVSGDVLGIKHEHTSERVSRTLLVMIIGYQGAYELLLPVL